MMMENGNTIRIITEKKTHQIKYDTYYTSIQLVFTKVRFH
jgi:hypothetical protein